MALSLLSLGCGADCRGPSPEPSLQTGDQLAVNYEQPPPNSAGTLRSLGPHLWEATYDRRGDEQGIQPSRDSVAQLMWADLDTYQFLQIDKGEVVHDEIRLDREIFRRYDSDEPYSLTKGIPGDSMILHRTLGMWDQAISPFAEQLAYERVEDGTVEGRKVRVYRLRLVPVSAAPGSSPGTSPERAATLMGIVTTPVRLDGAIYIDVETGNRLLAELEGRFFPRRAVGGGDLTEEVLVSYRESRSLTGIPVEIRRPAPSAVIVPDTARTEAARRARRKAVLDRAGGQ
ncbi:MAG: hypothetical protein CMP23_00590 [Rickettsiales bacterium]|nr:hypothetical protein [Rickettsiales bacterium]